MKPDAIDALVRWQPLTGERYNRTVQAFTRRGLPWLSKAQLQAAYRQLCDAGLLEFDSDVRAHLQMKPMRTQSGVAVVTVLTKPYPCPGKCIFCPTDVRMPKSYLHDEPGAQRAERHGFDPFLEDGQVELLEPGDLLLRERVECELGQGRAAPERERLAQECRGLECSTLG